MSCPDWCGCDCHVPDLFPLINLWIYGLLFALFLGTVFIRFMRLKADSWYLDKALLKIDDDDEMYDEMIQLMEERNEPERAEKWRQDKADRIKLRARRQGKPPFWLRGFYTRRAELDD